MTPVVPSDTEAANKNDRGICYMLELAHDLPCLDLSRTLARSLLGDSRNERFLAVMRRRYGQLRAAFRIGLVLMWITTFVEADIGRVLSVIALPLGAPAVYCSFFMGGIDMLLILVREHEFVYFTVINVLFFVMLALIYGDVRSLDVVFGLVAALLVTMSDALYRTSKSTVRTTIFGLPVMFSIGCMAYLHQIRSANTNLVLLHFGRITMETRDLLLKTCFTMCIFYLRILYRRHVFTHCFKCGTVPCVIHRARLKLVITKAARGRRVTIWSQPKPELLELPHLQHLRLLPMDIIEVEADYIVWPRLRPSQPLPSTWIWCHRIAGLAGVILSVATMHLPSRQDLQTNATTQWTSSQKSGLTALPVVALLFSLLYIVPLMLCYQLVLLASLLRKFEVLFAAFQFAAAAISVGDMLLYDYRCWALVAWFLWYVWILLFDALTPCTRARFGVRRTHAAGVIVIKFCCIGLIIGVMAFGDPHALVERRIFT